MSQNIVREVPIASGGTTSAVLACNGAVLVGFQMPSGWDSANMSFTASVTEGGTYGAVLNADGAILITAPAANEYIVLNPADFAGVMFLKFVSSATQNAVRNIRAILRGVE